MTSSHPIIIDGNSVKARHGELLLDAALGDGIDLPYDCRAGHCGTCCVRLVSGLVHGGEGAEPGIVHACQCRIIGEATFEKGRPQRMRAVGGEICSMRPLSPDVIEVGIALESAIHYHPGQYARIRFAGYPARPFSISHPVRGTQTPRSLWFHVRRMRGGRVTASLGNRIKLGHRVELTGPFGAAHFRPGLPGRLILVATNTGFAPIWSIAVAALRENPNRMMLVIAGGRAIGSLYMGPALERIAQFPNAVVVPVCSTPQSSSKVVRFGRPTEFLPRLLPTDVLYACGAPGMVEAVKSIAAQVGAVCHADPFLPTLDDELAEGALIRVKRWFGASRPVGDAAGAIGRPRRSILAEARAGEHRHS